MNDRKPSPNSTVKSTHHISSNNNQGGEYDCGDEQQGALAEEDCGSQSSSTSSRSSFITKMATLSLDGGDKPISPSELETVFSSDIGDSNGFDSSCSYSSSYYDSLLSGPLHEAAGVKDDGHDGDDSNEKQTKKRQVDDINPSVLENIAAVDATTTGIQNNATMDDVLSSAVTVTSSAIGAYNHSQQPSEAAVMAAAQADSGNPSTRTTSDIEGSHLKKWFARYTELQQYQKEHGHCSVPNDYEPNRQLGRWVKRQRHQHYLFNEGKHSTMTKERKMLLDSVGFIWDSRNAIWEHHYQELLEFKSVHGHCKVPSQYTDNPSLGLWVKRQRGDYKSFCDRLAMQQPSKNDTIVYGKRFQRLLDIGFVFDHRATPTAETVSMPTS